MRKTFLNCQGYGTVLDAVLIGPRILVVGLTRGIVDTATVESTFVHFSTDHRRTEGPCLLRTSFLPSTVLEGS